MLTVFALVTLFAIGLNTAVVWQLDALLVRRERLDQARTTAHLTAAAIARPLDADETLRLAHQVPGVEALAFYDSKGLPVASFPARSEVPEPDIQAALRLGETRAIALGPPVNGQQHLRV